MWRLWSGRTCGWQQSRDFLRTNLPTSTFFAVIMTNKVKRHSHKIKTLRYSLFISSYKPANKHIFAVITTNKVKRHSHKTIKHSITVNSFLRTNLPTTIFERDQHEQMLKHIV